LSSRLYSAAASEASALDLTLLRKTIARSAVGGIEVGVDGEYEVGGRLYIIEESLSRGNEVLRDVSR
jgi:hypothetical protein